MTTGHVFMAMSLDGFVAREDHSLDWLMKQPGQGEDHGYDAHMARMDGIVMGAGSFRTVLGFDQWPYEKPVVVMSRSMREADIPEPLRGKVRLSDKTPPALMQELDAEGWRRAYVDGGAVVRSFLAEGLVEDMTVTIVPILLGRGLRMFGDLPRELDLHTTEVRAHPSGLTDLVYRVKAG